MPCLRLPVGAVAEGFSAGKARFDHSSLSASRRNTFFSVTFGQPGPLARRTRRGSRIFIFFSLIASGGSYRGNPDLSITLRDRHVFSRYTGFPLHYKTPQAFA